MKVYDFIIEIQKPNYKTVNRISQLMYLLSMVVFSIHLIQKDAIRPAINYIAIAGMIVWWLYCIWMENKNFQPYYRMGLLIAAAGWFFIPNGKWMVLVYLLAAILEKQAKFPQEIAFNKEEIVFNSLPKKRFNWTELNNVLIKDDIITIDFKNNKLIQKEIQSGSTEKEVQEFNEFCKQRLSFGN